MNDALPFVSVIMPIRNEADFIERSLGAVLAQDYPHDRMEVLVADGMSEDDTQSLVARIADQTDVSVTIVPNDRYIVPTGFNAALKDATGEIIVRVDGHTIIEADYIRNCVRLLLQRKADNVGGKMNAQASSEFGLAVAAATSSPFGVGGARFHYSDAEEYVDTVYMGAWRREIFDQIGLFDEELVRNQDDEFNYRLRSAGGRILLSPAIKSDYFGRSTPRGLWRQYYQYGLYKVRVLQKHPRQMQPRQFVPFAFVASLGVTIAGALFVRRLRYLAGAIVAVYAIANIAASISVAMSAGRSTLRYLPVVFTILHFSYGLGFARGLIKFRGRWFDDVQR